MDRQSNRFCLRGIIGSTLLLWAAIIAAPVAADVFTYAKLGKVNVEGVTRQDPLNLTLNLGYEMDSYLADLSLAAEFSRSIDSGKSSRGDDLEFESNGLYLVYKSTRSLFASFRLGVVDYKTIKGSAVRENDGISLGYGIGIVIGRTRLQIDYTLFPGEEDQITLGLQF